MSRVSLDLVTVCPLCNDFWNWNETYLHPLHICVCLLLKGTLCSSITFINWLFPPDQATQHPLLLRGPLSWLLGWAGKWTSPSTPCPQGPLLGGRRRRNVHCGEPNFGLEGIPLPHCLKLEPRTPRWSLRDTYTNTPTTRELESTSSWVSFCPLILLR